MGKPIIELCFKIIDYFFMSSREDPCPIVMLESMYLMTPCFYLHGNITYKHDVLNDYCICNHDNDYKILSTFFKSFDLKKKERKSILKEYIIKNFTENRILNYIKKCIFIKNMGYLIENDMRMKLKNWKNNYSNRSPKKTQ